VSNVPAVLANLGTLAPAAGAFAASPVDAKSISEGISASFPILSFRGKVWRTKYRGEEINHLLPPAAAGLPSPGPVPSLNVVIVHASPTVSKIWYEGTYSEGDNEAPDCFSVNGKNPDPASPKKQAELCATCPRNLWGSKTLPSGKPGKDCQDGKRLVVVPADDMANELFGGPMLLRVPPGSMQNMDSFNRQLLQHGHKFFTVKTMLSFDPEVAYPKLVFTPYQALGDAEAAIVIELQKDPRTIRILSEPVDQVKAEVLGAPAQPAPQPALAAPAPAFQQPAMQVQPPLQPQVAVPMSVPAVPPAPVVPPQVTVAAPIAPVVAMGVPLPAAPAPVAPVVAPVVAPIIAPQPVVQQTTGQPVGGDGLDIPAHLKGPAAPQPIAPWKIGDPYRALTSDEIARLPDMATMAAYMTLMQAEAAKPKARKTKAATVTPPPSPTPTPVPPAPAPAPVTAAVATPAITPAAVAPAVPVPAAPTPVGMPVAGAADPIAALDGELAKLLG
jgi:hypothetical protein